MQYLVVASHSGELQAINSIITRNMPLITPNYPPIRGQLKIVLVISCPVFAKDPRTVQYLGFAGHSGELQAINSIITRNRPLITPNYPLIRGQ